MSEKYKRDRRVRNVFVSEVHMRCLGNFAIEASRGDNRKAAAMIEGPTA